MTFHVTFFHQSRAPKESLLSRWFPLRKQAHKDDGVCRRRLIDYKHFQRLCQAATVHRSNAAYFNMWGTLVICLYLFASVYCSPESDAVKELLKNYELTPPEGKVRLKVETFLRNVEYISSTDMKYKVSLTFRQHWNDPRLKHSSLRAFLTVDPDKIWTPDLFFSNEIEGYDHTLMKPNILVRVFGNGDILLSRKVSLVLSCRMYFRYFPFDTQNCNIMIASYGMTADKLSISWVEEEPVQVTKALELNEFSLEEVQTSSCDSKTNTGTYACVKADFTFARKMKHYLVHCYIPVSMCVIISLLSFWITSSSVRITLLMMDIIGAALLVHGVSMSFPLTDYTKSIDFFMGISMTFIFVALVEFIVVYRRFKREPLGEKVQGSNDDLVPNSIDRMFVILMPLLFFGFVAIYFLTAFLL